MFFPVLLSIGSRYSAPPENTHIETVARGFSADDDLEIIAVSKYADVNCFTAFVEDCRALLARFGLADSKLKLQADKEKGFKQITKEIADKDIESCCSHRKIVLNSMSFIEKKERGEPFIYIENDYGKVKITKSMTLEFFKARANKLLKDIKVDDVTVDDVTELLLYPIEDEDTSDRQIKYSPGEVLSDDFSRSRNTPARRLTDDDNRNYVGLKNPYSRLDIWWQKFSTNRPIGKSK